MATSVPQVTSINEAKRELAEILELAFRYGRESSDWGLFVRTVELARMTFEQKMKPAAHKGYLPWSYVAKVSAGLEKVEAIVARGRAATAQPTPAVME